MAPNSFFDSDSRLFPPAHQITHSAHSTLNDTIPTAQHSIGGDAASSKRWRWCMGCRSSTTTSVSERVVESII
jgi:hypothetical protein